MLQPEIVVDNYKLRFLNPVAGGQTDNLTQINCSQQFVLENPNCAAKVAVQYVKQEMTQGVLDLTQLVASRTALPNYW